MIGTQYEYKTLRLSHWFSEERADKLLCELGANGWKLEKITEKVGDNFCLFFSRIIMPALR